MFIIVSRLRSVDAKALTKTGYIFVERINSIGRAINDSDGTLLQLAPGWSEPRSTGEFDKAQFVYACLREDPDMKIADIQQRAAEMGQTISVGSVSQHRKAFFESMKVAERESRIETEAVAVGQ